MTPVEENENYKLQCQHNCQLLHDNGFQLINDGPMFYYNFQFSEIAKKHVGEINIAGFIYDVKLLVYNISYSIRTNKIEVKIQTSVRGEYPQHERFKLFNPIKARKIPFHINILDDYALTCYDFLIKINRAIGRL